MVFLTSTHRALRRIPLIKFRKGGYGRDGTQLSSTSPPGSSASSTAKTTQLPVIEDWELPQRFWRKPIEQIEMDHINRGGPA